MNITLNNRTEYFDKESLTVQELLDIKNFTFKMLIIKLNGRLIKKHEYNSAIINNQDNVIVLHLVSGG